MKNLFLSALFLCSSGFTDYMDKTTYLEHIKNRETAELWDSFLEVQADLFFEGEMQWLKERPWWVQSKKVLEIGSGNGAYLSKLAHQFPDKSFYGIEKNPELIAHANKRACGVRFEQADALIFNPELANSVDLVLFRLTLQHLNDPIRALQNAHAYLSPGGHVVIIESFDEAKRSSHVLPAVEETLALVKQLQENSGHGNRRVSMDLLQEFNSGTPRLGFEVVYSSLETTGAIIDMPLRFEGERDRQLTFHQILQCMHLFERTYKIPVAFDDLYDQLEAYQKDENAWLSPGMHFLVLKRIP